MTTVNDALLGEYRAHLRSEGASENTVRAYVSDLRAFLAWGWENSRMDSWEALAPRWLNAERGRVGTATLNRRATALRRWFDSRGDATIANPLTKYKCPPAPPGVAHPLPGGMEDVRKMLEVTTGQVRTAIALMGFAGLRVSEARAVTRYDVDWNRACLVVKGKGSKTRYVPVSRELQEILNEQPIDADGAWCTLADRTIRRAVTEAGFDAGIHRPVSSHDLRMTFGTHLYTKTKDLRVVQELMGHASSKTTERYTGITEATKNAAIAAALP